MYVLPDGSVDDVDVEPLTHMESEYGIFVSDAGKDVERMQKIESLAQAALQNGTPLSSIISIFESNSFAQIKDKVIQAEKAAQELAKTQQQAEQEAKAQEMQMQQQNLQMQLVEKEKDRQMQIEKALIAAESSFNGNSASLEKMLQDFQIKQEELALKERELEIKAQQVNKE
jgi:Cft2 family RNA processing exonuclease